LGCLTRGADAPAPIRFAVKVDVGHYGFKCDKPYPGTDVDVYVVEPKAGNVESREYLQQVELLGYARPYDRRVKDTLDKSRRQFANDQRVQREQQAEAAERARIAKELPLLKKRGTRVCQTEQSITYVGFVDDVNEDGSKIRALVKGTTTGFAPGGWQPGPEWAVPSAWHVCE